MTNIALRETLVEKDKLLERVLSTINAAMKESLHIVEGAPQASILMPDDTYRTKPVFGGQELFFHNARVGKSGKIIFSFTAADDMPWKQCEWDANALDKAVPLFGGVFAEAIKIEGEHLPTLLEKLIISTEKQMIEEVEMEKVAAAEAYRNSEKFGRF